MTFETIKSNYDKKLWNKAQVIYAVRKGVITKAEYTLITGESFPT